MDTSNRNTRFQSFLLNTHHITYLWMFIPVLYSFYSMYALVTSRHCNLLIISMNIFITSLLTRSPRVLLDPKYVGGTLFCFGMIRWASNITNSTEICINYSDHIYSTISLWLFEGSIWSLSVLMIYVLAKQMFNVVENNRADVNGAHQQKAFNVFNTKYEAYLTTTKPDQQESEELCSICLERFEKEDEICTLANCRHFYHQECIQEWFEHHQSCPYCRSEVLIRSDNDINSDTKINSINAVRIGV